MAQRSIGHIIITGTAANQAAINAGSLITAWTVQSDQQIDWGAPDTIASSIPTAFSIRKALDGNVSQNGFYSFTWVFGYWSLGMMDYFLDTFLTTSGSRIRAKACAVKTYDETDTAVYLNAMVNYPTAEGVIGGWTNVNVLIDFGTLVTS